MSVVTIFSGTFCDDEKIVDDIIKKCGYRLATDADIIKSAAALSGMPEKKIQGAFSSKTSVFNKFTHEKERSLAWMRLALAEMLSKDGLVIRGFSGLLIPKDITHALRICLIADMKFRISVAMKEAGLSEKDAVRIIHEQDEEKAAWVNTLFQLKDPWDPSLYDIIIPTDKQKSEEIVRLVENNLRSEVIKSTDSSQKAAQDLILAANVDVALVKEGHCVGVSARDGDVTLTINKHVLMLSRLEEELKAIAEKVPDVKSIATRVGKGYHQTDIYRKYDFELPKLLLVDDEREFVQTLSERLLIRDVGSAVAYDGESALDIIEDDDPEVMILDLKMPGIDGIEVLRRVKKTRPEIEVIILTGHGSEEDENICMDLGAFAYLQKPVNIDILSETLQKAKEKMRRNLKS